MQGPLAVSSSYRRHPHITRAAVAGMIGRGASASASAGSPRRAPSSPRRQRRPGATRAPGGRAGSRARAPGGAALSIGARPDARGSRAARRCDAASLVGLEPCGVRGRRAPGRRRLVIVGMVIVERQAALASSCPLELQELVDVPGEQAHHGVDPFWLPPDISIPIIERGREQAPPAACRRQPRADLAGLLDRERSEMFNSSRSTRPRHRRPSLSRRVAQVLCSHVYSSGSSSEPCSVRVSLARQARKRQRGAQ